MKIFVDIDNTITVTNGNDKIKIIKDLYDNGHHITYWTARGSASGVKGRNSNNKLYK